ncbi:hypothetical protein ANO11243_044000 [Dothideomycetidae sp. 11243]|nr:hypothetical protein ANO11243_044000 [fungal sp. No.11243]
MARFHVPFFRIFYSTTYTSLYIVQLILLAITPASLIYTAIEAGALQYIFIIGGVYILTAFLVVFLYSSRLYTNRTVLAAVGKNWIPIEEGEVSRSVRKLVKSQLERSALVALECRPRNLVEDGVLLRMGQGVHLNGSVDPQYPPWGLVQQLGWSSPNPQETSLSPQIDFAQIIDELPNLLEARAVSLGGEPRAMQDAVRPIDKVQKVPVVGIRDYLEYLDSSGRILIPDCAQDFIERYEHARFCGRPLREADFITLTAVFAELLSGMQSSTAGPHMSEAMRPGSSSQGSVFEAHPITDTETVASIDQPHYRSRHIRIGSVLTPAWTNGTYSTRPPSSSRRSSNASLQSAMSVIRQARGGNAFSYTRTKVLDVERTPSVMLINEYYGLAP